MTHVRYHFRASLSLPAWRCGSATFGRANRKTCSIRDEPLDATVLGSWRQRSRIPAVQRSPPLIESAILHRVSLDTLRRNRYRRQSFEMVWNQESAKELLWRTLPSANQEYTKQEFLDLITVREAARMPSAQETEPVVIEHELEPEDQPKGHEEHDFYFSVWPDGDQHQLTFQVSAYEAGRAKVFMFTGAADDDNSTVLSKTGTSARTTGTEGGISGASAE